MRGPSSLRSRRFREAEGTGPIPKLMLTFAGAVIGLALVTSLRGDEADVTGVSAMPLVIAIAGTLTSLPISRGGGQRVRG